MRATHLIALGLALAVLPSAASQTYVAGDPSLSGDPVGAKRPPTSGIIGTPIDALPFFIGEPGLYVLRSNLTGVDGVNGITVSADNVTIDLQGFELTAGVGSPRGVSLGNGFSQLAVRNGTIRGWTTYGIYAVGGGGRFRDLRLIENDTGIAAGSLAIVERCAAVINTSTGISAGIASTVRSCTAAANGGDGFTGNACVFLDCTARDNGDDGFAVGTGSIVRGCTAFQNDFDGIHASGGSLIADNSCFANGTVGPAAGIHVIGGGGTRVEGNLLTGNDTGIDVDSADHLIICNGVTSSQTTDYDIVAGNVDGPVVTSGGIATDDNPHANYGM